MQKSLGFLFLINCVFALLSGCSTATSLKNKLGDMSVHKERLANGQTVYMDVNVAPTPDWGCTQTGVSPSYNWEMLKTESQLHFTSDRQFFVDKLVSYANQQNLNTNYINLHIPNQTSFSVFHGVNRENPMASRSINSIVLNSGAEAFGVYYNCQKINPQHTIGTTKDTFFGVGIG